jgi:hypothetical protein
MGSMGWAAHYIAGLGRGESVQFRPRGCSMHGKVESGDLCTVSPHFDQLAVGDIVLCRVGGNEYLHLIKAVQPSGDGEHRYLIGNNRGRTNGWVGRTAIFGKLIRIES